MKYRLKNLIFIFIAATATISGVVKQSGDMTLSENIAIVKSGDIALPLNLTYKSNIRTNQRASWVGLGFSLDVPYIERIAVGSADEKRSVEPNPEQLVDYKDCFKPGVFDKNKKWEALLKPDANGFKGKYITEMTCPGTDAADGYFTEMNGLFESFYSSDCEIVPTIEVISGVIHVKGTLVDIGITDRPDGEYSAGILCTWLGVNCTDPANKTEVGIKENEVDYTNQQDVYILKSFFGGGRIVFANPSYDELTLPSGKTFKIYKQDEELVPYMQNYRPFKISLEYNNPQEGEDPDIIRWTIVDESGTEYVFDRTVTRINTWPSEVNERNYGIVNSHYTNGILNYLAKDGSNQSEYPMDERAAYPNISYVTRWYLSKIKGVGFSEDAEGNKEGNWIELEYDEEAENFQWQSDLYHELLAVDIEGEAPLYQREYWPLQGVSKTQATFEGNTGNFITAMYTSDDYYFYPVYPFKIRSPYEEVEFVKGGAMDRNNMGDQQLNAVEIRKKIEGSYQLIQKVRFIYDEKGLAVGHPYSKGTGTGLLGLKEIIAEDRFGNSKPKMKFYYVSNPNFDRTGNPLNGFFKHDFFGFYSSIPVSKLHDPFIAKDGQSTADAAAWSLKRVLYGNGRMIEYEYEPNQITNFNTGEQLPLMYGPGVRVKQENMHDGAGKTVTTTYKYGKGYTNFNMAIASFLKGEKPENYVGELYLLLNYGELYQNMKNVLLLSSNGIFYDQCEIHSEIGYERYTFLSPDDHLLEYQGDRVVSMADDEFGKNSKSMFLGTIKRVDIYTNSGINSPLYSKIFNYVIKHDMYAFASPEINIGADFVGCENIPVGGGNDIGDPPSFPDENIRNVEDNVFVGKLYSIEYYEVSDQVKKEMEFTYDAVSGSIKKSKSTNSDYSYIENEKIFAHEIDDYSWMLEKNMLTQTAGDKTRVSKPSHNNGDPEIISSLSNTWVKEKGGYSDENYVWNVDMGTDEFPVKSYNDFSYTDRNTDDWERQSTITSIDDNHRILESKGPVEDDIKSTIYRHDIGLPMSSVKGAHYENVAVFTGDYDLNDPAYPGYFDFENKWEKGALAGDDHISEVTSEKPHFGLKSIHVKNTYGPTRNIPLQRNKTYLFSAWIYPKSSTNYIRFTVELRDQNNNVQIIKSHVATEITKEEWQLVKYEFDLLDIPTSKIDGINDYFRIWIGNFENEAEFDDLEYDRPDFYVDDIRFHESTALVYTSYYNPFVVKEISLVDANSNCVKIKEFDGFGDLKKIVKKNKDGTVIPVVENEYHLKNEMTSGEIQLIAPDGEEILRKNYPFPIRWIASSDVLNVNIYLTSDDGANWTLVNTGGVIPRSNQNDWGEYIWIPSNSSGNNYKIKVVNSNGSGEALSRKVFTITDNDPQIPSSPSPANSSTDIGYDNPTLSWSCNGSGTLVYDVYMSTIAPPQEKIAEDQSTTSITLDDDLVTNNTYYWKVVAKNQDGTTEGPIWSFSTESGGLPYAILESPKPGTVCGLDPSSVDMAWNGEADNYVVEYWEPFGTHYTTSPTSEKSTTLNGLINNAIYYWKVIANKTSYASQTSKIWAFRVNESSNPLQPTQITNLRYTRYALGNVTMSQIGVKLQWDGGDDPNDDWIKYDVYFFVEAPNLLSQYLTVDKNTQIDYITKWEKYSEAEVQVYSWNNRYVLYTEGTKCHRKSRNSCFNVVTTSKKELFIPGVFNKERVHFYVRAINVCNPDKTRESDLSTVPEY